MHKSTGITSALKGLWIVWGKWWRGIWNLLFVLNHRQHQKCLICSKKIRIRVTKSLLFPQPTRASWRPSTSVLWCTNSVIHTKGALTFQYSDISALKIHFHLTLIFWGTECCNSCKLNPSTFTEINTWNITQCIMNNKWITETASLFKYILIYWAEPRCSMMDKISQTNSWNYNKFTKQSGCYRGARCMQMRLCTAGREQ